MLARARIAHRHSASNAYDIFVALMDSDDDAEIEVPAAIAVASLLHSFLAGVGPNRRLLHRIREHLGIENDRTAGRYAQPRRWTKSAQARTLARTVGQLRSACRQGDQAAAHLGLANATEREASARVTLELLSSFR